MKSIKGSVSGKTYIKKSLFICTIFKITTKVDAEKYTQRIKLEFNKTPHNGFVYRLGTLCLGKKVLMMVKLKGVLGHH